MQPASIISAQRLRECQGFVDKVSEIRFSKVRQRQFNKFNILINKKEGNITRANAINLTNNLASQAGRQASTSLPSREGSNPSQTGRQALSFPPGKEATRQAVRQAPPRQLLTFPRVKEAVLPQQVVRQALSFPLGKEAVLPQQVVRQALSFPLGKEAILPWQLLTFPWVKEVVLPQQVNQAIKLGQSGKVLGSITGIGHPRLPSRTGLSPGKTTSPLAPQ